MNILDIIIAVLLLIAAITGWRSGLTKQLFSLLGIVGGIILANRFGFWMGTLLGIQPQWAPLVGFILILIAVLISVGVLGMLLKKLFQMVGLGVVDNILGVVLSCAKYTIVIAILLSLFAPINQAAMIVPKASLDSSIFYERILSLGRLFIPSVEWMEFEFHSHTNSTTTDA